MASPAEVVSSPWKIILAMAFVGVAIAAGVIFVILQRADGRGAATTVSEGLTESEQQELDVDSEDPGRVLAADDLVWQQFGLFALPTSKAGPHQRDGVNRSGFDRSPAGAVLAAVHISFAVSAPNGPLVFERTIADQMVGSDKNAFLATVRAEYSASVRLNGASANGELGPEFEKERREQGRKGLWAYRLDSWASDTAVVQLMSLSVPPTSEPIYPNFSVTVKWVEGDWRLVAPVGGSWRSYARNLRTIPPDYVVIGRTSNA